MSIHVENVKEGKRKYRKYFCPFPKCEVWKRTYEGIKEHIKFYHFPPVQEFKCERCKKFFKTVRRLARHKCPYASPRISEYVEKTFKQTTL